MEGEGGGTAVIGHPGSSLLILTSTSCNTLAEKYCGQVWRNLYKSLRVFSSP